MVMEVGEDEGDRSLWSDSIRSVSISQASRVDVVERLCVEHPAIRTGAAPAMASRMAFLDIPAFGKEQAVTEPVDQHSGNRIWLLGGVEPDARVTVQSRSTQLSTRTWSGAARINALRPDEPMPATKYERTLTVITLTIVMVKDGVLQLRCGEIIFTPRDDDHAEGGGHLTCARGRFQAGIG